MEVLSGSGVEATSSGAEATQGSEQGTQTTAQPTGLESVAPAQAAGGTPGAPGETKEGGVPPVVPASYVPNLKYKVMREEKEFPEWIRDVLKNQENEKQVRELFEKAGGLDDVKQHRDRLDTENKQMREHWAPVIRDVQLASQHLQKKDYDSFFEMLGIPEADVLRYALHRIQLRENPQALQSHDQMRQLQLRNQQMEQQLQSLQGTYQETAVQARERELQTEIARPEILATVQAFEQRVGQPGAFRAEVIRRGQAYAAAGQDISAEQAVKEVLQLIGYQQQQAVSSQVAPPAPPAPESVETAQSVPQAQKPTLPHIRGKGTSPTKQVPKSIDDLRKLAAQMRGQ